MSHVVGTKGQVVIAKEIRDRLGIEAGWMVLQRVVGDHVELRFLPPEHNESLLGSLASYTSVNVSPHEWHEAREIAWHEAARIREGGAEPSP